MHRLKLLWTVKIRNYGAFENQIQTNKRRTGKSLRNWDGVGREGKWLDDTWNLRKSEEKATEYVLKEALKMLEEKDFKTKFFSVRQKY